MSISDEALVVKLGLILSCLITEDAGKNIQMYVFFVDTKGSNFEVSSMLGTLSPGL